jgi:hypothetical protein
MVELAGGGKKQNYNWTATTDLKHHCTETSDSFAECEAPANTRDGSDAGKYILFSLPV